MNNPLNSLDKFSNIYGFKYIINSTEFNCFYSIMVKSSNKYNIELLFREIGSVSKIRETDVEKLESLIGSRKSRILVQYFAESPDVPRESIDE